MGMKGDDAQRLQCLVKPTGGKLIDGQSAATITLAIEDLFTLASLGGSKPPAPAVAVKPLAPVPLAASQPTAKPAAGSRTPLRKDGPPAIRLATVLGPGQPPSARPVRWTIRRLDSAEVVTATGQDVSVPLSTGDYTIEARDGLIEMTGTKISLAASGETGLDLPLTAGLLRASVAAGLLTDGLVSIFQDLGASTPAQAAAIIAASDLAQGFPVPPGKWIVRMTEGTRTLDRPADIKAGATVDLGPAWPFGRLQVSVSGELAGGPYPMMVQVFEDDPDAPRGRREVARSASTSPEIVLPAGTYAIVARQGSVEARDRVVVQGGETVKRSLALAGARLTLLSRLAGSAAGPPTPGDEPVAYRIERLDVVPPEFFAANRQKAELDLPAGRYRVEARHGLINARAAREITIAAGQATAITLEQQAGTVRLAGPPGGTGELLWEILDDTGHPLWSTAQLSPRATLQAGRYTVRLEYREKRLERRIEIRAGETRVIDVRD
jgi:Ca-activated chloride channel homolog